MFWQLQVIPSFIFGTLRHEKCKHPWLFVASAAVNAQDPLVPPNTVARIRIPKAMITPLAIATLLVSSGVKAAVICVDWPLGHGMD
jgi:hypothetical protein